MTYLTKGEMRLFHTLTVLTHPLNRYTHPTGAAVVRDGDRQSDAYHERIARQAERWVRFAKERSVSRRTPSSAPR